MGIDFTKYLDETIKWIIKSGPRIVIILVLVFLGVKLSHVVALMLSPGGSSPSSDAAK